MTLSLTARKVSQPLPQRPLAQTPALVSIPGFSRVLFVGLTTLLCTELTQCDTPQSVWFSFSTKICNHAKQPGNNPSSPSTEIWVQLAGMTASRWLPRLLGQCRLRNGSQQLSSRPGIRNLIFLLAKEVPCIATSQSEGGGATSIPGSQSCFQPAVCQGWLWSSHRGTAPRHWGAEGGNGTRCQCSLPSGRFGHPLWPWSGADSTD